MLTDIPLVLLAATVATYWGTVALLVLHKWIRQGRSSGLLPRHTYERRLWALIVPVVLAWIVLPFLAGRVRLSGLRLPTWGHDETWAHEVRRAAAVLAVAFYLLSLYCWLLLGRHWSMAIVPGQTSRLVTRGVYRWVRHPIYSLSMGLMLASAVVLPTVPMVLVACLHLIALNLKARYEEHYLEERFGSAYAEYCSHVGRFWPRWCSAHQCYSPPLSDPAGPSQQTSPESPTGTSTPAPESTS
jgi:protein-S-isoprenylcysteine O-methyltransferase Ste14